MKNKKHTQVITHMVHALGKVSEKTLGPYGRYLEYPTRPMNADSKQA